MRAYGNEFVCSYCNVGISSQFKIRSDRRRTKDHLIPRAKGGKGIGGNKVWCCTRCNKLKGSKTLEEFHNYAYNQLHLIKEIRNGFDKNEFKYFTTICDNIPKLIEYRSTIEIYMKPNFEFNKVYDHE